MHVTFTSVQNHEKPQSVTTMEVQYCRYFYLAWFNFKWLHRVIGPLIALIFECSCQNAYQIFSIKANIPLGLKIILCALVIFVIFWVQLAKL